VAEFLMPSLGADMEAGTLVQWLVEPGDTVHRGDVVASVETAKGIIDIEIFADGVIESLAVEPGTEIPVGGVLARYSAVGATGAEPARSVPTEPTPSATAGPRPAAAKRTPPPPPPLAASAPGTRTLASPAARRRAAELGIGIETVATRSGGAVTLQDVERAAATRPRSAPAAPTDMRAVIAQSMSRSKREIPHYYLATTIDMRRALDWVADYNASHPVTERLLNGVLLIKAVARALERFPDLNGFWRDGGFHAANEINVGTATRLRQGGLVAPALLAANSQPLPKLMRQFQDVVQRARSGGLRGSELANATVTVSSLGEGGVETVFPIIHPPQVAIIGFGAITVRPWCTDGAVVAAPLVTATLAADHRASDGHRGSSFLGAIAAWLQRPEDL
jgi:pyruvate dehydrogenase E2 component (dihydrolipoamide acetyltransferase)